MFYETSKNNHGLKYNPFKSCIIPRPIAWITTLTQEGIDNCAPYSFFNGVASDPPMVMFANNGPAPDKNGAKDTFSNIKVNQEFVVDKMPFNFFYIGFILKSIPEAKIIHIHRNPMAVCWSNFKANFFVFFNGIYCLLSFLGRTTNLLISLGISTSAYISSEFFNLKLIIRKALLSLKSWYLLFESIIVTNAGLIFLIK